MGKSVLKFPLDPLAHAQDSRSRSAHAQLTVGLYAYVRDEKGVVWVVPDGQHIHPKILGGGRPAMYAGDLSVVKQGIQDLTNLSGTFQFDDPDGLLATADQLARQGLVILPGAVRFFPADGGPPRILR